MQLLDAYKAAAFNPLTSIPWAHAHAADGPEMLALGLADAAAVATWPDEIGTADMTQVTAGNRPTWRAAGTLNGQPSLRFDGVNDNIANGFTGIAPPFTVVLIAKLATATQGTTYVLLGGLPTSTGRADIMTNTTPTPDQWMAYGGANITGAGPPVSDTAARLHIAEFVGSSGSLYTVDGTVIASGVTSTQTPTGLIVGIFGNGTSFPAPEDATFLGIIGRVLTTDEKAALRTWSQGKYGTA